MRNKAVNTSPSTILFALEYYKSQKMCDKAVDTCSFVFDPVPGQYKIQEIWGKVDSKNLFQLKYCLDRYKTQEMHDKAIDAFLTTLKFVHDKKLDDNLLSNDEIIFVNKDFNMSHF